MVIVKMFCCSNCFVDSEIKAIVEGYRTNGECNFCGETNAYVYEIGKDEILSEVFDDLLDIYTPATNLPDEFPQEATDLIADMLYKKWHIFNLMPDRIYGLITTICAARYREQPDLFDTPVGIMQVNDPDYLENNSILKKYKWEDFVESIKHHNRFHNNYINGDILCNFLQCTRKTYKAGSIFYRARICPSGAGFTPREMSAPPAENASAGRVNSEGISVLYLANSEQTTLYEIRAGVYDYVTLGEFELQKDIEVINLADIDKISPFIGIDNGFDMTQYAVNIEHLKTASQEIAKPLRRHDSILDYIPTQYISDYIKSKGFDGIEYMSTMCEEGLNIAVFDQKLLECAKTTVYDVRSIRYSYKEIANHAKS